MLTAAATATANRIPLLLLPGDVYASRQPDPVLQQIEQFHDPNITANDAFRAVSRYWDRIARPDQLMSAGRGVAHSEFSSGTESPPRSASSGSSMKARPDSASG